MTNLTEHKCKGKCPEFKTEQCNHCLITEGDTDEKTSDFVVGDMVVVDSPEFADDLLTVTSVLDRPHLLHPVVFLVNSKNKPEMFGITLIRHATHEEKATGKRLFFTSQFVKRLSRACSLLREQIHLHRKLHGLQQIEIERQVQKGKLQLSDMEACYIEKKKECDKMHSVSIELHKSRDQAYKHLESCENSLTSQTIRFNELYQKLLDVVEIINNPDNHYVPFSYVAEQLQDVLGEAQGEVA